MRRSWGCCWTGWPKHLPPPVRVEREKPHQGVAGRCGTAHGCVRRGAGDVRPVGLSPYVHDQYQRGAVAPPRLSRSLDERPYRHLGVGTASAPSRGHHGSLRDYDHPPPWFSVPGRSVEDAEQRGRHGNERLRLGAAVGEGLGDGVLVQGAAGLVLQRSPDPGPPLARRTFLVRFLPGQPQPLLSLMYSSVRQPGALSAVLAGPAAIR